MEFQIARWAIERDQVKVSILPGGQCKKSSGCQEGNEMGSLEDLIDCQVGREENPILPGGQGREMRLSESLMNSEVSSYQQERELREEDQKSILMIGGNKGIPTKQPS
jgi:hypothetical protein